MRYAQLLLKYLGRRAVLLVVLAVVGIQLQDSHPGMSAMLGMAFVVMVLVTIVGTLMRLPTLLPGFDERAEQHAADTCSCGRRRGHAAQVSGLTGPPCSGDSR